MATGTAGHIDPQPDTILVVINEQFPDGLNETAGRALVPQGLAAAAVIMRFTCPDSQAQCLAIHIALHQHLTSVGVSRDSCNQAAIVEFRHEIAAFFDLFDRLAGLKFDL